MMAERGEDQAMSEAKVTIVVRRIRASGPGGCRWHLIAGGFPSETSPSAMA